MAPNTAQKLEPKKVIVYVDDLPDAREMFQTILHARLGQYEIVTIASAEEVLEYARTHPMDLLISDLTLPGMSGFDLIRKLRTQFPKLPVIVVSGHSSPRARQKASDLNCQAYFEKPYKNQELFSKIVELIEAE